MKPLGVILAGGRAQRMGGVDKGLLTSPESGQTLIEQIIEILSPQVGELLVVANRNLPQYAKYCPHVIPDTQSAYQGPLYGILSAMQWANERSSVTSTSSELMMVVPCDTPFLPADIIQRLATKRDQQIPPPRAIYVHDGSRAQPLHVLLEISLYSHLSRHLASANNPSVYRWLDSTVAACVDFSDCPNAFRNMNSLLDLKALSAL